MQRYRRKKPDLQALYKQKEQEKIERVAEEQECHMIVKRVFRHLKQEFDEHPDDIEHLRHAAQSCVDTMRRQVQDRKFKHLGQFDIDFIWENEMKRFQMMRGICVEKK